MKLKKWLALGLAAALVLSAVHGQYRIVSAEEAGEETVTAEAEDLNAEGAAGEYQPQNAEQEMEDGEITGNASSENTDLSDNTQSAEMNPGSEKDQNSGSDQNAENKQGSGEKEEMETGESGVVSPADTSSSYPADPDTSASDPSAEEHKQDDPAGSDGDGELPDKTAVPEENEFLKTEEPATDDTSVENGMLESAGEPEAQAGDIASGTDRNINWRIDADGKLTVSGVGDTSMPWYRYRDQIISAEVNVSGMTNASYMFEYCSNLSEVDVNNFDTTNVMDMRCMFYGCRSLSRVDISNFDTTNVTDMEGMFWDCRSLSGVDVSNFDTSNVTNMGGMFEGCSNLNNIDVSNFDTSNVTNMDSMFEDCNSLSRVGISNFDTSNVTNMRAMFYGCSSLSGVEVSNFDTSSVTDMSEMFSGCKSLSEVDVSNFDTSNVTDMWYMFSGCSNLSSMDVSSFDTSNVTDMRAMFLGCYNLSSLDVSNFDTVNVTDMSDMFDGCSNLTEIHSPYNINCVAELPTGPDILWLLPDGTEVTELPKNLPHSVTITCRRNPKIITTTPDLNMSDVVRVKYVPYSYTVQTDNWDENNIVTYSLVDGELAEGLMLYPATGEIYGTPLEAGEFPITVKAEFSNPEYLPSYADLTLTVFDNTDGNVSIASDPGYEVEQYLGTQLNGADGIYYAVRERNDQLFVSAGENGEFYDLWLNGVKLTENEDYTRESGSTRITVRSQTLENKTNKDGVNTIAAEFRVGGDRSNDLKRTAQNFRIDFQQGGGSGDNFQQGSSSGGGSRSGRSGSGGGSSEEGVVSVSSATAVVRLVNAAGNPLTGAVLELHSTPQTAQTDRRGTAVFAGVTAGLHTLYVKDGAGNVLASRSFELLLGDKVLANADQVTAKAGGVFTVQVQMKENELAFLSVQEGDVYQVASAGTGDEMEPGLWLLLLLLSGVLGCGLCAGYRKRRMY